MRQYKNRVYSKKEIQEYIRSIPSRPKPIKPSEEKKKKHDQFVKWRNSHREYYRKYRREYSRKARKEGRDKEYIRRLERAKEAAAVRRKKRIEERGYPYWRHSFIKAEKDKGNLSWWR